MYSFFYNGTFFMMMSSTVFFIVFSSVRFVRILSAKGQTKRRSLVVSRLYIQKAAASCSSEMALAGLHSFRRITCLAGFLKLDSVSSISLLPTGFSKISISEALRFFVLMPSISVMISLCVIPARSADE